MKDAPLRRDHLKTKAKANTFGSYRIDKQASRLQLQSKQPPQRNIPQLWRRWGKRP